MKKPKPIRAFRVIAADCCAPTKPAAVGNCYPCAVLDVSHPKQLIEQVATLLNKRANFDTGLDFKLEGEIGRIVRGDARAILRNLGIIR